MELTIDTTLGVGDGFTKQLPRGSSSGGCKTHVYYPPSSTRPRSYSAGSPSLSTSRHSGSATATSRLVNSRVYGKAKSLDDGKNSSVTRYKTELCRPFLEYGYCKYGEKCQFAHGEYDLRLLPRHPKYKTELCRTYHSRGFCPYGSRCHFIHNLEESKQDNSSAPRSPTKTPLSLSLPISPPLDSGISSPDDFLTYSSSGGSGRTFEFPSSGSDEDDSEALFLSCSNNSDSAFGSHEPLEHSPDGFVDYDMLSSGSGSPVKHVSEDFAARAGGGDQDLAGIHSLLKGMALEDNMATAAAASRQTSRLPVFDDMLNSKSDTALIDPKVRPFTLFPQ